MSTEKLIYQYLNVIFFLQMKQKCRGQCSREHVGLIVCYCVPVLQIDDGNGSIRTHPAPFDEGQHIDQSRRTAGGCEY